MGEPHNLSEMAGPFSITLHTQHPGWHYHPFKIPGIEVIVIKQNIIIPSHFRFFLKSLTTLGVAFNNKTESKVECHSCHPWPFTLCKFIAVSETLSLQIVWFSNFCNKRNDGIWCLEFQKLLLSLISLALPELPDSHHFIFSRFSGLCRIALIIRYLIVYSVHHAHTSPARDWLQRLRSLRDVLFWCPCWILVHAKALHPRQASPTCHSRSWHPYRSRRSSGMKYGNCCLGLFQKLFSGGHYFSNPSTSRTHMESEPPDPQDT